ncbi:MULTISPECIES: AraC family transcriptional regulator [Serratia]|uniref:AraC family transcriptional regulator n=1 Tax=Serratia TaxID=613 RepID=UPI001B7C144D|nr:MULTISPECIES: AraC family transcriptional regulator [Serratia]MBP1129294.1 AraC-like DNA-binding protein [Serratia sp. PL17]
MMDPLSDIVSRLKISSQKIVTFDMAINTKALFPEYSGMKIYIAKSGSFFIKMDGDTATYQIDQGDVLILSSGREFSIFDNANAPSIDIRKIHVMKDRSSYFTNGGNAFSFVGCRFVFQINDTFRFITSLPEPIVIKTQREENEGIKDFLTRLSSEIEKPGPGAELITEHLLQIIFTQALRVLLSSGALGRGEGWFYAMADKNIGLALTCIHDQPGKKWRLDDLAKVAGMSRTAFTTKFRRLAGYSVNEYIRVWRFSLAIERMVTNKEKISQIAFDLGYESESAFSTAFKKSMGESPRSYISNHVP